jgi:tRNA (guanine-N7-)-methyltransferase
MGKRKLKNFAELLTFPNVVQKTYTTETEDHELKGKWNKDFFKNDQPIVLELGCGKGEYTIGMARLNPEKNYLGIDLKGSRIWRGAKTAIDENLKQVGFLRAQIDRLPHFFDANEVSEIWITFPDPQPQQGRERKRLTSPEFIARYEKFCKTGALIHFKTDNRFLFDYTIEVLRDLGKKVIRKEFHVHRDFPNDSLFNILTHYEGIYLKAGKPIHYLCFEL